MRWPFYFLGCQLLHHTVPVVYTLLLADNRDNRDNTAICIISGGLDSLCVCAYLSEFKKFQIKALTFSYGQRAKREINTARKATKMLGIDDHRIIDINFMKELYGNSNVLTSKNMRISQKFNYNLVVPLRNAIFITIASAWAFSCNAVMIAYGAHANDSRYPDCRPEFAKSIAKSLNLAEIDRINSGLKKRISIWSPSLDGITKSQLVKIGYKLLGDKIFQTWSCYSDGVRIPGNGLVHCGRCESCINRKRAFSKAGIEDKTAYASIRK